MRMTSRLFLTCLALLMWAGVVRAQQTQTMNFDQSIAVDPLGNGKLTIKMRFNASQFQMWQSKYGANKSLLKRDMGKMVSQYDTYDWDVSEKQMEREVTVSVSARGVMRHLGGGRYEFDVPAEWRGGERRDNRYTFNFIQDIAPGVIAQNAVTLEMPADAREFADTTGNAGQRVIRYTTQTPASGGISWIKLVGGLMLGLFGLALAGAGAAMTMLKRGN
jgi:hypothetical protein